MATANGIIRPDRGVQLSIDPLNITTGALVLENSPAVLSLGKLCQISGFTFNWQPGSRPVLTDALGFSTELEVRNFVPILSTDEIYACPITDSEGTRTPSPTTDAPDDAPDRPSPASEEQTLSADETEVRARMYVPLEHLLAHLPAERGCVYCMRAKAAREPARRVDPTSVSRGCTTTTSSTSATGYGSTT